MKHLFITAAFCIGFLMADKNACAQNNTAPAAKIASDENALKPSAESAKTSSLKQGEPKQPIMPAFQKSTTAPEQTAAVTAPAADITKDAKAVEIKANTQAGKQPQNADRPKTSTIQPAKKTEPLVKPMPVAAPAIEGR